MNIPIQIDSTAISRAANAAHYEYLATVRRRTEEIRLENDPGTRPSASSARPSIRRTRLSSSTVPATLPPPCRRPTRNATNSMPRCAIPSRPTPSSLSLRPHSTPSPCCASSRTIKSPPARTI